ncbi:MAG: mechanosensitive ion channel domain-containing protein [Pseudomonadota bacterium]
MVEQIANSHPLVLPVLGFLGLILVAIIVDLVAIRILTGAARAFAKRSRTTWDDALVSNNVIGRSVQILPAMIVYSGVSFLPEMPASFIALTQNVAMGYIILMLTLALNAALSAGNDIYETYPIAKQRPLKGFVQLAQIVVWILGGVMIVAAVMDRSPLLLLSGFGAMTAILLLVFKDTILSLVASVQLTAQDMVRVGDWIEMPQFGADGDVVDVQLHTVKVQNWDKTITTIPTHRLITDSFRNWRGMSQSGGRRIKRALMIDKSSIRFQTDEEVAHFKRFRLLNEYITLKEDALSASNARLTSEEADMVNRRRLTNLGTFRAYVRNYLRDRDDIRADMTLLVRQLAPGAEGVPLEIYCFTNTTAWGDYENIQGDIFDHLMSIVDEFGLRLYQQPAGSDLSGLLPRD